jgi:CelD/BcsL family acetyltransferase involved in cellulose biosynthesis
MPDCRLLRSAEELEAFAPEWRVLLREDPRATPFQSPEWLLPWWREFQQPDLRAAVISIDARPVAFLPFYLLSEERALLLLGVGVSDYLDGVFSASCSIEHVRAALSLVMRDGGWDVLHASQLHPQSLLGRAIEETPEWKPESYAGESCSRIPAAPLAELPLKIRRNAMYYRNRALRLGTLELELAGPRNCQQRFEELVDLHTQRWTERGEPGVLSDRRVLAWHRAAIPALQASGALRLYSLRLNGETIAALYALADSPERSERSLYIYLPGHAARYADLRPGTLLLALAIQCAAEEGIQIIDMLRGNEAYKQHWHPVSLATRAFSVRSSHRATGIRHSSG